MKQLYYTLFILSFLLFLTGCLEDPDMDTRLQNASVPELGELTLESSSATTIVVKATVRKENGAELTERGFKYWPENDPGNSGLVRQTENLGTGEYRIPIENLHNGVYYQITSFAANRVGTAYGDTLRVNTTEGIGLVETSGIDESKCTATTIAVEGVIKIKGEGALTSFGFRLHSEDKDTTFYEADGVTMQIKDSLFVYTITGLNPNTKYDIEAFAANSFGDFNSNGKKSYTTKSGLPVLGEGLDFIEDFDFVQMKARLISPGDAEVDEIGFCWGMVADINRPSIDNEEDKKAICTVDENDSIQYVLDDLKASTYYYVRAYAKNKFGITYSKDSARVVKKRDIPTLFLNESSTYVMQDGIVTVTGELQSEGRSPVTSMTLYYTTKSGEPGPDNKEGEIPFSLQEGTNSFSIPLKLMGGTKYFIRVYATNGSGQASNNMTQSFTTPNLFNKSLEAFIGTGRQDFITFGLNNHAFILGGKIGGDYTNELFGYSTDENRWARLTPYPSSIQGPAVCSDNNTVYIIGGRSSAMNRTDCYTYNSGNDDWNEVRDMTLEGYMVGLLYPLSFMKEGSIVVIGGEKIVEGDISGNWIVQDSVNLWNGQSWSKLETSFPARIKGGVVFTSGDSVIVGLGTTSATGTERLDNRKLWINTSGDWTQWDELTTAPAEMGNVTTGIIKETDLYLIDNKGFIWKYGLEENQWYKCSKFPYTYYNPQYEIMVLNDVIYLFATNSYGSSLFYTYNPVWDVPKAIN